MPKLTRFRFIATEPLLEPLRGNTDSLIQYVEIKCSHNMASATRKLLSAIHIWREHGVLRLINTAISIFESYPRNKVTVLPLLLLYELHLIFDEVSISYTKNGNWVIFHLPEMKVDRIVPSLSPQVAGTRHGSSKHIDIMRQIYTYESYVSVDKGDIVVDVGSYVGSFTFFAAPIASKVVAIEPTAKIDPIYRTNLESIENVTVVPKAAWKCKDTLQINQSSAANENSILSPDKGAIGKTFEVSADTVPNIVEESGIDRIDFLKIEAEGVEPEIVEGAMDSEMEIGKIAVDASPERDEKKTHEEVIRILESNGYTCQTKDHEDWWGEYIVFARRI